MTTITTGSSNTKRAAAEPTQMTQWRRTASLTFGGRNLWLSKASDFQGWDPGVTARNAPLGQPSQISALNQNTNYEEFTVPQPRRLFARLNVTF